MANFAENGSLYLGIPICITSETFPPTKQFLPNFFAPYNPKSTHFYFVSFFRLLGKAVAQLFFPFQSDFLSNLIAFYILRNLTRGYFAYGKKKIRKYANINAA